MGALRKLERKFSFLLLLMLMPLTVRACFAPRGHARAGIEEKGGTERKREDAKQNVVRVVSIVHLNSFSSPSTLP